MTSQEQNKNQNKEAAKDGPYQANAAAAKQAAGVNAGAQVADNEQTDDTPEDDTSSQK